MARPKKKPGPKPKVLSRKNPLRNKSFAAHLEGDTFKIEKEPPPPVRAGSVEAEMFNAKLDRSVKATPLNGAFIIPSAGKPAAQRHLKDHADFAFKYFVIPDNQEMMRVYKIKRK
jgi:hypothetical protein